MNIHKSGRNPVFGAEKWNDFSLKVGESCRAKAATFYELFVPSYFICMEEVGLSATC